MNYRTALHEMQFPDFRKDDIEFKNMIKNMCEITWNIAQTISFSGRQPEWSKDRELYCMYLLFKRILLDVHHL